MYFFHRKRNSISLSLTLKTSGSNPVRYTRLNAPTQFEQVDETYE